MNNIKMRINFNWLACIMYTKSLIIPKIYIPSVLRYPKKNYISQYFLYDLNVPDKINKYIIIYDFAKIFMKMHILIHED